jgi:hypothetical protein
MHRGVAGLVAREVLAYLLFFLIFGLFLGLLEGQKLVYVFGRRDLSRSLLAHARRRVTEDYPGQLLGGWNLRRGTRRTHFWTNSAGRSRRLALGLAVGLVLPLAPTAEYPSNCAHVGLHRVGSCQLPHEDMARLRVWCQMVGSNTRTVGGDFF